jgi:glycosyltransferase involved in cell wall biosynthesis
MSSVIWYISKYVVPQSAAPAGVRGFCLLQEFVRKGHTCFLFTSDSNHFGNMPILKTKMELEDADGVHVIWLRTLKYQGSHSLRRILSWIDFELKLWVLPKKAFRNPDIVIASSLSLLSILNGIFLKRKFGAKLVFEVRDIWPLTLIETGKFSRYNPCIIFLAWVEKFGYKQADLIVGTMPNLQLHVANVLGFPKPVHCIPQGVDASQAENQESASDSYLQTYIPEGKFIVCHAGSIGIANALDTLFDCAQLMKNNTNVHFLILGEGPMKSAYQKKCTELSNITFAPRIAKSQVQSVLQRCDLVYFACHASKLLEFGQSLNKIIDYMLSGKPVVASYSGFPSMINEADCGSYVPAYDAPALQNEILKYAALPSRDRDEIGARGREWVLRNRSFSTLADRYLQLLNVEPAADKNA